jgi:hypothetical protein
MRMAEFIERLCHVLRWQETSFSIATRDKYYCHLTEGIEPGIATLEAIDPDAAETTRLLLETLTPEQRLDFISAPHIAGLIISPGMFQRSVDRNFFLKALGICAGCISDDLPLHNHRGELPPRPDEVFSAGNCRVSFGGELPIPFMDRGGNSLDPVLDEDAKRILCKVSGAKNLIRTMNEKAHAFSLRHTEVLAFRYESEYPGDFSSGSFQTLPGFSLICNCHLPAVKEPELADAIIHEAIHSIIYQFEAFGEKLLRAPKSTDFQVVSPWTGARLGVESFAQACLVWFGLLHFWKAAADHGEQPRHLHERARKGFLSPSYVDACHSTDGYLAPHVSSLLAELKMAI